MFDYIFYRTYKFYQKRDETPAVYASGIVSVMQFFLLLTILAIIRLMVDFPVPQKYFVIPTILILIAINWYRYELDFDIKKLEEKWGGEDINRRKRKGWFVVISLISVILLPIGIGALKHNLGIM